MSLVINLYKHSACTMIMSYDNIMFDILVVLSAECINSGKNQTQTMCAG